MLKQTPQTSDKHTAVAHLPGWQKVTTQSLQTASQALGAFRIAQIYGTLTDLSGSPRVGKEKGFWPHALHGLLF